jgi:hypothetical protein
VDVYTEKIEILEVKQNPKVGTQTQNQIGKPLFLDLEFAHLKPCPEVNGGATDEQQSINRLPRHVEVVAAYKQKNPSPLFLEAEINHKCDKKKNEIMKRIK